MRLPALITAAFFSALHLPSVTGQEAPAADAPAETAPDAARPPVIDAAEAEKLRALEGQRVIVVGSVAEVNTSSAGNVRVTFTGGAVSLYIRKADITGGWQPAELKGRALAAGGVLGTYRGQLQIPILKAAQIADSADALDIAALPAPAAGRAPGPFAPAAAAPAMARVAYTQLRADFSGDRPLLLLERMEAAFERTTANASPVKVEPFSQKAKSAAASGADAWKAVRPDKWPAAQALSLRRVQGPESGMEPCGFGVMLAAEAMVAGLPWPDALMVAGRAAPGGRPAGGANEVHLLPDAVLPAGFLLMVPASSEAAVRDLLLDGAAPTLARVQLISAPDLDSAAAVLRALQSPETRAAMKQFDEACAPLLAKDAGAKSAELLKSGTFRTKMAAVSKALPWHLSAKVLAGSSSLPPDAPYSLSGTAVRLCAFLTNARPLLLHLAGHKVDTEAKKKYRDLAATWRALQARAHPQWAPLTGKIEKSFEVAKSYLAVGTDRDSTKAKQAATAVRNTLKEAEKESLKAENYVEPGP
jgi:hypothetical protein